VEPLVIGLIVFTVVVVLFLLAILFRIMLKRSSTQEPKERMHKDLNDLKSNISALEKQGLDEQHVVEKLSSAGWQLHLIDLVFKDLHKPTHAIDKLQDYALAQKKKGVPLEVLKESLLDSGWNEDLVDIVLGVEDESGTKLFRENLSAKDKESLKKRMAETRKQVEAAPKKFTAKPAA